jgi:small subunit ribosomal protein S16
VAVKIRMTRMGTNKKPYYRIIAVDSRKKRDGAYLENLGVYHPLENEEKEIDIREDRVRHWLDLGAKPSHTVKTLLHKKGISLK